MAQKKLPHNWTKVRAGDVISFRYKQKTQTILVLNPRLMVTLKNGKNTEHLIGIKIEENNKPSLKMTPTVQASLNKIGKLSEIDTENNLFKLEVKPSFIVNDKKGIKPSAFDKISTSLGVSGAYRTYTYEEAKKSAVYLEPIKGPDKKPEKVDETKMKPGDVWQREDGTWASKNSDGSIQGYKDKKSAEDWSRNLQPKQKAEPKSEKPKLKRQDKKRQEDLRTAKEKLVDDITRQNIMNYKGGDKGES